MHNLTFLYYKLKVIRSETSWIINLWIYFFHPEIYCKTDEIFWNKISGKVQKRFSPILMKYTTHFQMSSYRDQASGDGCQVLVYEMDGLLVFTIEFMCHDGECQQNSICMQHSKQR